VPHVPSRTASSPASPPGKRTGRLVALLLLAVSLTASVLTAVAASPAAAATACDPGSDTCVVTPSTAQTPLGPVTVTVSAENVVTVQLAPTAPGTLVLGIPFAIPPGPPALPGYARTSIATAGGEVDIDTFLAPSGSPGRFALPNAAIVSIHPPGPCHVRTSGTTVVFTPIFPPGPPT
jgi:hypothetical protein